MTITGDDLLRRLSQLDTGEDRDALANRLLEAFFSGYPLENLRTLLVSSDTEVVKTGIWIASELGSRGRPLLGDVEPLLAHHLPWVRFLALDCITTYTTEDDGAIIAKAVALVRDQEESVRRKASRLLMQISEGQLQAALTYLVEAGSSDSELVTGLRALVEHEDTEQDSLLTSESAVLRKFGVAGAVRRADIGDASLRAACASNDDEVRRLAEEERELRWSR